MKLVPKVLIFILAGTGLVLLISMMIQNSFTNKNIRNIIEADILETAGLLQQFVTAGEMEKFSEFLTQTEKKTDESETANNKIVLFTQEFTSNLYSGSDIKDVTIPPKIKSRIRETNRPFVVFGKEHGEVFWPAKTVQSCLACHEDMKVGELGSVLYLRFPLNRLKSASAFNLQLGFIALLLVFALLSLLVFLVLNRYVKSPILEIRKMLTAMGDGKLQDRSKITSRDEIGEIGKAIDATLVSLSGMVISILKSSQELSLAAGEFSVVSSRMASTSIEMSGQSSRVASTTEESAALIANISSAAEQMSLTVKNVATAIEEISASLNEVAKNCANESRIAANANVEAQKAKEMMGRLEESTKNIAKISSVISDIAEQTNLLALNATIEAASAGEAGKGFAVVANEVKELARQTAQATDEIEKQIEEMQSSTEFSVKGIEHISTVIEEVNSISQTIAATVEEQSATINEIAKNVSGASQAADDVARNVGNIAKGIGDVAANTKGMNKAVQETTHGAEQTRQNAQNLTKMAADLQSMVGRFEV